MIGIDPGDLVVIEQAVAGGEPQAVTVPALTYDYSQPIDTQAAPPPAEVADPAVAKFDAAREAFHNGDYAGALGLTDEALKVLPNDATLHEFRALVLFAVGKYDLAAGPLYAVLSVGPGWDWTTLAGLYPSIDVYTAQLRKLEARNSQSAQAKAKELKREIRKRDYYARIEPRLIDEVPDGPPNTVWCGVSVWTLRYDARIYDGLTQRLRRALPEVLSAFGASKEEEDAVRVLSEMEAQDTSSYHLTDEQVEEVRRRRQDFQAGSERKAGR